MLFNSFEFLFFFPVVVILFYVLKHKYRWVLLLLASYFFYMSSQPELALLLFISTTIDYYCAIRMHEEAEKRKRKKYLIMSVIFNLGLLFTFKYLNFFFDTMVWFFDLLGMNFEATTHVNKYSFSQILLPVGISFYTFQTMSYSIDVYRGKIAPERHFGKYALYVSFFPQLVAGPIERANRLLPQLKKKVNFDLENVKKGIVMMAWGFFLKLVVADRLGVYVDEAFARPTLHKGLPLIVGSIFFGFQIYYDFSAYTSIAIGAAKVIGVDLMQNFNRPNFSTTSMEFWRRWHISLMLWMKDYMYKPMVESKRVTKITAVLIVFFANGLWHGANWTFVVWSLLNAILLLLEAATQNVRMKVFKKLRLSKRSIAVLGCVTVIGYLIFTLIFFRSPNVMWALYYINNMRKISGLNFDLFSNTFELVLSFGLIVLVQLIHYKKGNDKIYELVLNKPRYTRWALYFGYVFVIVLFAINRQNRFIYFQF